MQEKQENYQQTLQLQEDLDQACVRIKQLEELGVQQEAEAKTRFEAAKKRLNKELKQVDKERSEIKNMYNNLHDTTYDSVNNLFENLDEVKAENLEKLEFQQTTLKA